MDNKSVIPGNEGPSSSTDLWPSFFFARLLLSRAIGFWIMNDIFMRSSAAEARSLICSSASLECVVTASEWNGCAFAAINSLSSRFECEKLKKKKTNGIHSAQQREKSETNKKFKSHIRVNHGIIRNLLPIFFPLSFCSRKWWLSMRLLSSIVANYVRACGKPNDSNATDWCLSLVRSLVFRCKSAWRNYICNSASSFRRHGRRWAIRRDRSHCDRDMKWGSRCTNK